MLVPNESSRPRQSLPRVPRVWRDLTKFGGGTGSKRSGLSAASVAFLRSLGLVVRERPS